MRIINYILLSLSCICSTLAVGQNGLNISWTFQKCELNGVELNIDSISESIPNRKYKKIVFYENDSIKLRAAIYCSRSKRRIKKIKVRFDIFEKGKWYKSPFKIDTHGGRRFRINRVQCWGKTSWGYNARDPLEQYCQCNEFVKKDKHNNLVIDSKIRIYKQ